MCFVHLSSCFILLHDVTEQGDRSRECRVQTMHHSLTTTAANLVGTCILLFDHDAGTVPEQSIISSSHRLIVSSSHHLIIRNK